MGNQTKGAWDRFEADIQGLAGELKRHYRQASDEKNTADLNRSLEQLRQAADAVFRSLETATRDPEVRSKTKETARQVIRKVVDELEKRLANPLRQAVTGSLNRATRNRRPRHNEIDWARTIRANLKNYDRKRRRPVLEALHFFSRVERHLPWHIIMAVDCSGSMMDSVTAIQPCDGSNGSATPVMGTPTRRGLVLVKSAARREVMWRSRQAG